MKLPSTCRALGLAIPAILFSVICIAYAQEKPAATPPVAAPATQPTTKPAGPRSAQQILMDIQSTGAELSGLITSPSALTDEAKRNEIAPKIIPVLKKMLPLMDELAATDMGKEMAPPMRAQMLTMLELFGDPETHTKLEQSATTGDMSAKCAMLLSRWIKGSKDAAAQGKVLDEATELAKANPQDTALMQALMAMNQIGAATPQLGERAMSVIADNMKGKEAEQLKEQMAGEKKLNGLENKPLEIKGVRSDGSNFTTADWKGKVILVDFWATWCGPCREELPRVKKAYADFHDKGLEVLGVSCDNSGADLKKFLSDNPDMPWPQLFDEKTAGWHPLAKEYGINGIPTMFLIDKKGVVRTVRARENFEELIPKMLAE